MITLHDIRAIIARIIYPASKDEILFFVRKEGYPDEVAQRLERLPETLYGSADSVIDILRDLD